MIEMEKPKIETLEKGSSYGRFKWSLWSGGTALP